MRHGVRKDVWAFAGDYLTDYSVGTRYIIRLTESVKRFMRELSTI